jgi:hypothetical protein
VQRPQRQLHARGERLSACFTATVDSIVVTGSGRSETSNSWSARSCCVASPPLSLTTVLVEYAKTAATQTDPLWSFDLPSRPVGRGANRTLHLCDARPDSPLRMSRHHWMIDRDPSCFDENAAHHGRVALFCNEQIGFSGLGRPDTATAAHFVQVPADTSRGFRYGRIHLGNAILWNVVRGYAQLLSTAF